MTQKTDHIAQLLDQAPHLPSSPQLRRQIMVTALLDIAPETPTSPALHQNIMTAAARLRPSADIINFTPQTARQRFYPAALAPAALAGGLMTASLLLGIWTGTGNIADNFLGPSFEIAGLSLEVDETFGVYDYTAGLDYPGDRQ